MRQQDGKGGTPLTYKCPTSLPSWHRRPFWGKAVGRGLRRGPRKASPPYQSPSRCQIGPRSRRSFASSGKHSQRCSAAGARATREPVGKVKAVPKHGTAVWKGDPPGRLLCSAFSANNIGCPEGAGRGTWRQSSTECRSGNERFRVSATDRFPAWPSQEWETLKHSSFTRGRESGNIRSPTLKWRGVGFWGCLQIMKVSPKMSSSSSPAPVVYTGSPESRWRGHWASIRHRMVTRRAAGVKMEKDRSNSRG